MRARTRNQLIVVVVVLLLFVAFRGRTRDEPEEVVLSAEEKIAREAEKEDKEEEQAKEQQVIDNHKALVAAARLNVVADVDDDHMHGHVGLKDGVPAFKLLPPVGVETLEDKKRHHTGNAFNLRRSDGLSLDRKVNDVRHSKCKTLVYSDDLPIASIIFVFHNEPISPLLRSVHSILNRTPPHLLHEIILVDDFSDKEELQQQLDDYVALLPKTKILRLKERSGLMLARTMGCRFATGEVAVFLDSHIEASPGWLEPLLNRIKENNHNIVMPIIDGIDADSLDYHRGGVDILTWSWRMGQAHTLTRPRSEYLPMKSVIMAGGLFAMDRKMFHYMGEYDPGMKIYGGEEVEISFRLWQCGFILECIPCSRVGHIFRSHQYWNGGIYPDAGETILRNKLRAAAVWMDDYKYLVYDLMAPPGVFDLGDMTYMYDLRKRLKCKSFQWFLDNVNPEAFIPTNHFNIVMKGELRNPNTDTCLDTLGEASIGHVIGAYQCHHQKGTQHFLFCSDGLLRVPTVDFNLCVDRNQDGKVSVWGCQEGNKNQIFKFDRDTKQLTDESGTKCLEVIHEQTALSAFNLLVKQCDEDSKNQKWEMNDLPYQVKDGTN